MICVADICLDNLRFSFTEKCVWKIKLLAKIDYFIKDNAMIALIPATFHFGEFY